MTALTRLQWEYKLSSLPLFTQTWLTENTLDFVVTLDGIQPVRVDQSARESGKGEVEEPRTHYDESTKDIELSAFGRTRVPEPWFQCQKSHVPRSPTINRPVALISLLMKTKLRLILHQLRPLVSSALDLLQFAYQPGIRVDNGVIYLLHSTQSGMHCWEGRWRESEWTSSWLRGRLMTSPTDHSHDCVSEVSQSSHLL